MYIVTHFCVSSYEKLYLVLQYTTFSYCSLIFGNDFLELLKYF